MSRRNKQITIYPEDDHRRIVGGNTPACNRAIACWALALKDAMPTLSRAEWNFLADVLNGSFDGDLALGIHEHGAQALALEVHDAQALNGTGDKWFGRESKPGSGQAATDALREKILGMSWLEIQYIRTATNFFWSEAGLHHIDHQKDEWWTIPFRVRLLREAEEADA